MTATTATDSTVQTFSFESYGVFVKIESNHRDLIVKAEEVVRLSLLNKIKVVDEAKYDHLFIFNRDDEGMYSFSQNGEDYGPSESERGTFKFFDSILRVAIGEYAVDRVFLHAGVVGWRGKAIILPADSFQGKSTLVAELVRNGAQYYSDEFAIIDVDGLVHSYPRRINMRTDDYIPYDITVEDLGGTYGKDPIPIGMILLTSYQEGATWQPEILTPGNGILKIIPFTLSIRYRTDFSMRVLHNVASHAIIASSLRGSAEKFAKTLLDFVDKSVN